MKTYDLVLFDLDDTLLDFGKARDHSLKSILARFAPRHDHVTLTSRFHGLNKSLWHDYEAGRITKDEVLVGRFARLFQGDALAARAEEINGAFLGHLADDAFLCAGAAELVASLSPKFPLCIISNGAAATQRQRLARSGLAPHFRFVVVSDEVGQAKPHPAIFREALRQAGLPPSARVLMIGDNVEADIGGAKAMGFDTCWLTSSREPHPTVRSTFMAATLEDVRKIPGLQGLSANSVRTSASTST